MHGSSNDTTYITSIRIFYTKKNQPFPFIDCIKINIYFYRMKPCGGQSGAPGTPIYFIFMQFSANVLPNKYAFQ